MKRTFLLLVTLSVVLVGCTPRLKVQLASDSETLPAPSFEISERKQKTPRYDTITVLGPDKEEVWQVRADPFRLDNRSKRVTYGQTPEDFEVLTEARPLEPGKTYSLIVEGKGVGFLSFEGTETGDVVVRRS